MHSPNPDKAELVELVNRLLHRSGLTIEQVIARMQVHGCQISRNVFENRFTTRLDQKPNIPPPWVIAFIVALTERLTDRERCTAAEAIDLARLAHLPIDQFERLRQYFPESEFITAYSRYGPLTNASPESLAIAKKAASLSKAEAPDIPCPYRGLQVFEEEHAEFFFGRTPEIEQMLATLRQSRFLAVIGPSGSGKSSVVRAGLVPALRRGALNQPAEVLETSQISYLDSANWRLQLLKPGPRPLESLAFALLSGHQNGPEHSLRHLIAELKTDEQGLHLLTLELLAGQPDKTHLALVVDQVEELFTLCGDEAARRTFLSNLLHAAALPEGRTIVILTMRADFYSQAALYPDLARHLANWQVLISPMTQPALTAAITRPAQKVGLLFETGLEDRLLQDAAAEPGALPLLQHALLELWERRTENRLTLAAYQASGGVHGALARRADSLLNRLNPEQQAIVKRVMLRLTKLGEGTADTRRRATLSELVRTPEEESEVRAVVTKLADARLVTTSINRETGEEIVDVAHEALIRGWPRLQGWLANDREALRLHQRLAESATEWERHNREESYLYRGARLAAAEEWAATHAAEMNEAEREFLTASLAARAQKATERERRRRWTIGGLTIALLLTLGLALLAFSQRQQVDTQRQMTLSRQLAAQAGDFFTGQLDLALLLSTQASQIAGTLEARSSLLAALETSPHLITFLRGHSDWVWSVAFSPDGQILASGSADGTIRLWDISTGLNASVITGQLLGSPLTGHTDWVRSVAFSPDGQILASASADDTIMLWDVATRQPLGPPLTGHTNFVTDVAFSLDGQTVASSSADGTVMLWDVATGQPLGLPLTGHISIVLSVAFSPDGQTLASAGADETIILWDIATRLNADLAEFQTAKVQNVPAGQPLAQALIGHQGAVFDLAFSPAGNVLASGSADTSIILWDVATGQSFIPPLVGHTGPVSGVAFSPDGQLLVSGSEDKTILVWDVSVSSETELPLGQPLESPFIGHTDRVLGTAFNPNLSEKSGGRIRAPFGVVASGSADGTVILWAIPIAQPLDLPLGGHDRQINNLAFSPDGQMVVTGGQDGNVVAWDVEIQQPLGPPLMSTHTGWVVALSPDGQIVAAGNSEGEIILLDAATGRSVGPPLTGHTDDIQDLTFSPDGQMLASGSENGVVILWNVETHQMLGQPLPVGGKSVAFSPDGQKLAVGGVEVFLWDVVNDRLIGQPMSGHTDSVLSVGFSPDGKILTTGGMDRTIILWDVATHQPIRQPLTGHSDVIASLAFSPDSQTLASGSWDKSIILWDVPTQQPLGPPLVNEDRVRGVAFSPDGQKLVSGGRKDGRITVRDVSLESWQERACQMVARNLTRVKWEQFLGDEPYRATCANAPLPTPDAKTGFAPPTPTRETLLPVTSLTSVLGTASAAIVEKFDSSEGFIQTSPNVSIVDGQVKWHIERSGGKQYVYRTIPPFNGNVRLTVKGQVDDWTNNCRVEAGIGDGLSSGLAITFGFNGGGCPTNGPLVDSAGVSLDRQEITCEFTGNWLWIEQSKSYTAELTVSDGAAILSVAGVGDSFGTVDYEGPYTTLWVGRAGDGDWPECTGTIDLMIVEPLN